jgi:hypothetical protein
MASYKEIYLYEKEANHLTSMQTVYDQLITPAIQDYNLFDHAALRIDSESKQTSAIDIFDENNNRILIFGNDGVGKEISGLINRLPARYYMAQYNESGSSAIHTLPSVTDGSWVICGWQMMYGYICKNGVIINGRCYSCNSNTLGVYSNYPFFWVIFTMNQNRIPVGIMMRYYGSADAGSTGPLSSDTRQQSEVRLLTTQEPTGCWTDASPLRTFGKAFPATRNQSVLVPFFTNSQVGQISYTPFAGRFIAGNNSSFIYDFRMHLIEFNDTQYLTNGVWAIEV